MANAQLLEKFNTLALIVEQYGGGLGNDPGLIESKLVDAGIDPSAADGRQSKEALEAAEKRFLVMALLMATDKTRYGKLLEDLENDYTKGHDNYPVTVTGAYNLIVNYKQYQRPPARGPGESEGVSFANVGDQGKGGRDTSWVRGYSCQELGHYASKCPKKSGDDEEKQGRSDKGTEGETSLLTMA